MLRAFFTRTRDRADGVRACSSRALQVAVPAVLGLLVAATGASGHAGHAHPVYGPPAPDWAWPAGVDGAQAAASQRDARGRSSFDTALAQAPAERGGRCVETAKFDGIGDGCRTSDGLLRVELAGGGSVLTHGPDFLEGMLDTSADKHPTRTVAAVRSASKDDVACVPDDTPHTRIVYAIPSDGVDRSASMVEPLRQATYETSAVLDAEARALEPSAGRRLRVQCEVDGHARIEVVRLRTSTANADFSIVQDDLHALLGTAPGVGAARLLVYYDAHLGSFGGIGEFMDSAVPDANNPNNAGGRVALQDNSTGGAMPNWKVLLHEAAHNMGAVATTAPDSNTLGHCNDGLDVMCYEEGLGTYVSTACSLQQFDCDHDSYFHPSPPAGSWLASHWNIASTVNRFLHPYPAPTDATPPSQPGNLQAVGHGSFITLTWDPSSDPETSVHGYRVYRDDGATLVPLDDAWGGDTSIDVTWTGITASTSYTLVVRAFDEVGHESSAAQVTASSGVADGTVRTVAGSFDGPTDIHATARTSTSITLAWQAAIAPPGSAYRIQRRIGTNPWSTGATTSALTYTATGLLAATQYQFRVTAYDPIGRVSMATIISSWTSGAPDVTAPGAPSNLHVVPGPGTAPLLAWDGAVDSAAHRIWAQDPASLAWMLLGSTSNAEYAVTGISWGESATLGVTTLDEAGNESTRASTSWTAPPAPDVVAPSQVTSMTATRTTTSITPTWSASTDNVGVVGYRVWIARADTGLFTLRAQTSGALSATVTGLTPGTSHQIRIQGIDAAGNGSSMLYVWSYATLADVTPPPTPTGLVSPSQTSSSVSLSWNAVADASGISAYRIFRQDAGVWTIVGSTTSTAFTVTGLAPATSYTLGVRAVDTANLESTATAAITVSTSAATIDVTPPTQPTSLAASGIAGTGATLTWNASSDDQGVVGYRIWRTAPTVSGTPVGTPTTASHALTGLTPATTYTFEVEAIDAAGNVSPRAAATFTTPDTIAPSTPGGLTAGSTTETSTTLSWTAATDNVGVIGYRVERIAPAPTAVLTTTTGLSHAITGLQPATAYAFRVTALDAAGNGTSASRSLTTPDATAPTQPGMITVGAVTGTSMPLSWGASFDAVAVTTYRVYRDAPNASATPVATIAAPATSTTITGLASQTSYTFSVTALDAAGNESPRTSATAATLDVTAPTQPGLITTSARTPTTITMQWPASTDSAGGPVEYRIWRREADLSWTLLTTTTLTSHELIALTPSTSYTFGVTAIDGAGNASARTSLTTSTTATPDTTAPGQPGPITVGTVTGTSIALAWGAASDDVGVTGYRVYRQSPAPSATPIATPGGTSSTLAGLTSGVSYTFAMSAVDAAGNEGPARAVTVATSDVVAPSQPSGLMASALGETSVRLEWSAASDNVGVTGYRVLHIIEGVPDVLGTTASLQYDVTGLTAASTHEFRVEAFDAAGLASTRAATSITTPDLTAPTAPTGLVELARSDSSLMFMWNPSTDNVAVDGYRIWRVAPSPSITPIATVGIATIWTADALAPDTDYTYEVAAIDAAGNEGMRTTVTARTLAGPDVIAPTVPLDLTAGDVTTSSATLSWSDATDDSGIAEYRLERFVAGGWQYAGTSIFNLHVLTDLDPGTIHVYRVVALDAAGNESTPSTSVQFTTAAIGDTTPPTTPAGPLLTTVAGIGAMSVSWGASMDAVGVLDYRVWLLTGSGWLELATTTELSAEVAGLPTGQLVRLGVSARDAAGNDSGRLLVEALVPPALRSGQTAPSGLAAFTTMQSITLVWDDDPEVDWWRVDALRDGVVVESRAVAEPTASFEGLAPASTRTFEVRAMTADGTSGAATLTASTLRDTLRPTRPGSPRAASRLSGRIAASWSSSRDNIGIARYELRLATAGARTRVIRVRASQRALTVSRLLRGRTYVVSVRSVDRAGNPSPWSTLVRVRVR